MIILAKSLLTPSVILARYSCLNTRTPKLKNYYKADFTTSEYSVVVKILVESIELLRMTASLVYGLRLNK